MKNTRKKGFTIVELVIVIAVIAILAAVLIPTFSNVIEKANQSAAQQEAAALYKEVYALDLADGKLDGKENDKAVSISDKTFTYTVDESAGSVTKFEYTASNDYKATFENNKWTIAKAGK